MFLCFAMGLQRCLLAATRQYLQNTCILQSNIKQTYCELYHKYSTGPPRRYSDRHEWITVEKGTGTVGISKYAQESLGDVVFAQLPDPGTKLIAGDECGALESVKAASEIFSPVSGKVLEKNKMVEDKPALINTSYYNDGWLFKLELTKPEELDNLMDEEAYELFLNTDVEKEKTD